MQDNTIDPQVVLSDPKVFLSNDQLFSAKGYLVTKIKSRPVSSERNFKIFRNRDSFDKNNNITSRSNETGKKKVFDGQKSIRISDRITPLQIRQQAFARQPIELDVQNSTNRLKNSINGNFISLIKISRKSLECLQ